MTATNQLRFIDPKNDVAFKKIFGDENHSNVLLEFLNEILAREHPILEVEILNPYQLPRTRGLKLTALDIRARDKHHEFLIEMQVEKQKWFAQRVMHYVCQAYASQLKEGDNYDKLKPVVFLGVLNFHEFPGNHIITRHTHCSDKTFEDYLKQLEFNFIELPNFNKKESELTTLVDQWLYFLKNAQKLDQVPESVTSTQLRDAYERLQRYNWTQEELEAYDYWARKEQSQTNAVETARLEGIAKGVKKGIKEGEAIGEKKGKLEVARNLLDLGLGVKSISEATQLSVVEIEQLAETVG